jgi:hypothetical protein
MIFHDLRRAAEPLADEGRTRVRWILELDPGLDNELAFGGPAVTAGADPALPRDRPSYFLVSWPQAAGRSLMHALIERAPDGGCRHLLSVSGLMPGWPQALRDRLEEEPAWQPFTSAELPPGSVVVVVEGGVVQEVFSDGPGEVWVIDYDSPDTTWRERPALLRKLDAETRWRIQCAREGQERSTL